MENAVISLDRLRIGYPRSRNDRGFPEISARLAGAELTVLMGRNGAGKSTLLRTVAGLQAPLGGGVRLAGRDIARCSWKEKAELTGFVSTEKPRVADLSVFEMAAMGRYSRTGWLGSLSGTDRDAVFRALETAGVSRLARCRVNEISDGELQRVMIARALAQDTPIIVLDEPTAFLDLPNKFDLMLLLGRLARRDGKTVLLSTHDLDLALRFADNMWILSRDSFRRGAPEDFALAGGFDEMFAGTGIRYDYDTGSIDARAVHSREISVDCPDVRTNFWLLNALSRMEFRIVEGSDRKISVCGNTFVYRDCRDERAENVFGTIYELGRHLIGN
jgi:iron complex transport system ATP-binding protein